MKTDKKQLMQAIEAIEEKLASIKEELNKPDEYKHFPSKGDEYYYYISTGIYSNTASDDELRVNAYKTEKEADNAYNKAVAIEKIKRRILELQGDWKPDFDDNYSSKYTIRYDHRDNSFVHDGWKRVKYCMLIPYMENKETALTIINEFHEELKLIFDIQ